MKSNIKLLSVFGIVLFLASCDFQPNVAQEGIDNDGRISEVTDQTVLGGRMDVVHTPINIFGENDNEAELELTCGQCDEYLSGSGDLNLNGNDRIYCILSGETYTANNLNFNGGTLKVCGTLKVNSNMSINGNLENSGVLEVKGEININGRGSLINTGTINGKSNLNSGNILKNHGKLTVDRDFKINGGAVTENYCSIISGGEIHVNSALTQNGYMEAGSTTHINGGGSVLAGRNSYYVTRDIHFNGDFKGVATGASRLDITNQIVTHNNGMLRGFLDVNYQGTIEDGKMESTVTRNGDIYIAKSDCNPGAGSIGDQPCGAGKEFTLISSAKSPKVNNRVLSATDVRIRNGYAYVTYHTNIDKQFGGGIEIINVNNKENPVIEKSVSFNDTEFNNVYLSADYAFLSGQRDLDESHYTANDTKGAIIGRFPLTSTGIGGESSYTETPIPGFSANSSYYLDNGNKLLAVAGGSIGAVAELSENLDLLSSESISYGKSLDSDGSKIVMLIGGADQVELRVLDMAGNEKETFKLDLKINPLDGKNVVVLDENRAYITLSDAGLAVIDLQNGSIVGEYNHGTSSLTNGVDVDSCFVYLANGSDGLVILNKKDLSLYGTIELPSASANFVRVDGDLIYVANGRGGLNIIRKD